VLKNPVPSGIPDRMQKRSCDQHLSLRFWLFALKLKDNMGGGGVGERLKRMNEKI